MINLNQELLDNIIQTGGSPVYIFNQNEFEQNYHEIEDTFREVYSNYHICYSYKTNYTPAICKCVKELGGYAEVVSDMEYELALRLGYEPGKIVYNGPVKGKYLKYHLLNGGINNIDRIEEAEYICELAKANPNISIKTGIRINFDVDAGYTSRFGIDIHQLGSLIEILNKSSIEIAGLHCHLSRARGKEAWIKRARTMLEVVENYQLDNIDYISLGSGMYGHMDSELRAQFPGDVPTYKEYADCVLGQFEEYYKFKNKKPIVFTEPGTTLISKYVDFLGQVIGVKKVRERDFVLMNCSFHNLGETCQMKKLPIKIFENKGQGNEYVHNASFVGYTCLEQDILYRDYSGEISIGDYVLFGNVGGYSIVDKPPFIMPSCPIVAIKDGQPALIRHQEEAEDIFKTFVF